MRRNTRNPELEGDDLTVVRDVARFRWMATDQIARRYGLPPTANPARIQQLCQDRLLAADKRQLSGGGTIYEATRQGMLASRLALSTIDVNRRWVYHHLTVVDVADALVREDTRAQWRAERQISGLHRRRGRQRRWFAEGHTPDGQLITSDGQTIAIEVETSEKHWIRYVEICRWYAGQLEFDAVHWYVAIPNLRARLPMLIAQFGLTTVLKMTVHDLPPGVEVRRSGVEVRRCP
jgi:hypothetical protein